jgi:hypothetical protein
MYLWGRGGGRRGENILKSCIVGLQVMTLRSLAGC